MGLAIALAILPSALMLFYFVKRDRFPEPKRAIAFTFFFGVLSIIPAAIVSIIILLLMPDVARGNHTGILARATTTAFFGAAIPEEFFKFSVLYLYCRRLSAFDEPMDGIVYGVTASLGFATLENILYVLRGGIFLAVIRAFTAVPAHTIFGATMGSYFGLARFIPGRRGLLWAAYLLPMLLHGLYDLPLMAVDLGASPSWALAALLVLLIGTIVAARLHGRLLRAQAPRARRASGA